MAARRPHHFIQETKNKMKRSVDRILTTHVGSLIRPQPLQDCLWGPLVERHDRVHAAERLQHRDPVRLWNQGTFQNLEPAYRVVGVQTPYQTVPERPRGGANVPLST